MNKEEANCGELYPTFSFVKDELVESCCLKHEKFFKRGLKKDENNL